MELETLEADIRLATSGRIADEPPNLDDRPLRGIMLTPRIAGIMLALIARVREAREAKTSGQSELARRLSDRNNG